MTDLVVVPQPGNPLARCGATNPTLGLTCNREPHPAGTTHYEADGSTLRAWPDPLRVPIADRNPSLDTHAIYDDDGTVS